MFASASLQKTIAYDQPSCQLRLEGLPDLSSGQGGDDLGILTRWTLRWAGRPELEGERHHLEALISAVLPYARHLVSGVPRSFGTTSVRLSPSGQGRHTLQLVSSQPEEGSLDVQLDDAELADLVRALDRLRLDPRVRMPWPVPAERPLRSRELVRRIPLRQRLAAPAGGLAALALAASLAVLLPPPSRSPATLKPPAPLTSPATPAAGGRP
ncbi:MAG: DUF4335 domain-containing protein [Cyanobium sp.]